MASIFFAEGILESWTKALAAPRTLLNLQDTGTAHQLEHNVPMGKTEEMGLLRWLSDSMHQAHSSLQPNSKIREGKCGFRAPSSTRGAHAAGSREPRGNRGPGRRHSARPAPGLTARQDALDPALPPISSLRPRRGRPGPGAGPRAPGRRPPGPLPPPGPLTARRRPHLPALGP